MTANTPTDYTTDANNGRELRPIGWTEPTGATVTAHLYVTVLMDNHTPARAHEYRVIEQITWPEERGGWTGNEISIPGGMDAFPQFDRALWLLDDGQSITPYVSAGYHPQHRYVGLRRMRPEAGRPGAGYGPRRTYYLMVTHTDTGTGPEGAHDYRTPCGCEHESHFPEDGGTEHAHMAVPAGDRSAQHVGPVCDACADGHIAEYLV